MTYPDSNYNPYAYNTPTPQPPKKRRVWPWVLGILVVLFFLFVGCSAIVGSAVDEAAKSVESGQSVGANPPEQATANVGATVRDGKLEFTVTNWDGVSRVSLTVTNIGSAPTYLSDSDQVIIDDQGREFKPDSDFSSDLWLNELNPGQTVSGTLDYQLFGANPVAIELHDSFLSGGARENLK
jgi:hypothetical protein